MIYIYIYADSVFIVICFNAKYWQCRIKGGEQSAMSTKH